MEEKEVLKILTQVNVTKRECEIVCSFLHSLTLNAWQFSRGLNALIYSIVFFFFQRLESTDFDEKKEINKRKQMILEGKASLFFLFGITLF